VVVDKYDFSGGAPVIAALEFNGSMRPPLGGPNEFPPVYSWNQSVTGASSQPTVLNFSMAVDSNAASYQDPLTGATQGDPNSGVVVFPITIAPPSTSRATIGEDVAAGSSELVSDPFPVGSPA